MLPSPELRTLSSSKLGSLCLWAVYDNAGTCGRNEISKVFVLHKKMFAWLIAQPFPAEHSLGRTLGEAQIRIRTPGDGQESFAHLSCLAQIGFPPYLAHKGHDMTMGKKEELLGNKRLTSMSKMF